VALVTEAGMKDAPHVTFTFETAHHALWAEDLAREREIPAEVVPAPSASDAKCGLALRIQIRRASDLEAACTAEGIRFQKWE
jgi:hypothetical protein